MKNVGISKRLQTIYLTVTCENDSDNTSHLQSEVNNLFVYDYEKIGVECYKISALLQVGNENEPVTGELGYGESSLMRHPNSWTKFK